MKPDPLIFIIDSQHITDPEDNNTESLCGLPVGRHALLGTLDLGMPTCETCLRIFVDRLADARAEVIEQPEVPSGGPD